MRAFVEPTMRNLLRRPLVLGVPTQGLLALSLGVISLSILIGSHSMGNALSGMVGLIGYSILRIVQATSIPGWEESLFFPVECWLLRRTKGTTSGRVARHSQNLEVLSPDTLTKSDLVTHKEPLSDRFSKLGIGESVVFRGRGTRSGLQLNELEVAPGGTKLSFRDQLRLASASVWGARSIYSLTRLPVYTDPLWLFGVLSRLRGDFTVLLAVRGLDPQMAQKRLERVRRITFQGTDPLSDVDADITHEETTRVLQGLSRGDDSVVEISLVIASDSELALDPGMFHRELRRTLPLLAVLGLRKRFHRSHWVRVSTAADLVPSVGDPSECHLSFLKTQRGNPLYFSPQDRRLEALHWLVSGASGSGKSFFTGLVLRRMVLEGTPMSVILIDHNRSFRRLVRSIDPVHYIEPASLGDLRKQTCEVLKACGTQGTYAGVELSDLPIQEKREAAQYLLAELEAFLRRRTTAHPIYVVLDECWNFLREDSLLIQRAFREFRKLNGAVVAITQSLHDFLTDPTGQSIFQNAPIRILLRQGEDLEKHRGVLGLNEVELERARRLRQVRGEYSECLIKTPFLSRIGRLYPTPEEYELFRTDNLREEWVREHLALRSPEGAPR